MISSGPRSGFLLLTLTSVHGLRFAVAAWNSGAPGAGTANVVVQLLGLVLVDRVGERVAELVVGQRHRAAAVARVASAPATPTAAPRSAAAARRGTAPATIATDAADSAAAGEDLGQQPAERVPDDRRLALSAAPIDVAEVVGDLADGLVGEHLGVARWPPATVSGSSGQPGVSGA